MDGLQRVVSALKQLHEDTETPRNVKTKIISTIQLLSAQSETSIKVSKALGELEGIAEDINMPSYTRTQIFNIVSLLEIA